MGLLRTFSWQEARHHPWRTATAVVAVMLGVALAFAVHLINASALAEFGQAVSAVNGQPDLQLRARRGQADDTLLDRLATHPDVAVASPVLELGTHTLNADNKRLPLRVLGVDALTIATVAPTLMPSLSGDESSNRLDLFAPDALFLNPAARLVLGDAQSVRLPDGKAWRDWRVAGTVQTPGEPLVVMDIASAQDAFDRLGRLNRIDLRLRAGADATALRTELSREAEWLVATPETSAERISNLSRAYRVNLTVLALVALFTGAFLVYSVVSLGVAKRAPQFALLGVLGLDARQRARLVLTEAVLLGLLGSALGLALGTALAALALRLLGGDLGGGYFSGAAPALRFDAASAGLYGALGVAAAALGGWWPARTMARLAPAQALKGLGALARPFAWRRELAWGLGALGLALLLAFAPPVTGLPVAAYVAVGLLLVGGIVLLPPLLRGVLSWLAPHVAHQALPQLALERARRVPEATAVATSGVVAALALSVALTVMVASFRDSVTRWLDVVLPAPLYLRAAPGENAGLSPELVHAIATQPGVARVTQQRNLALQLTPERPPVTLLGREWDDATLSLPLVGATAAVPPDRVAVYASEALVDLYGARVGQPFAPLAQALGQPAERFVVAGVWRDYARQHGSIAIALPQLEALLGETRVNELQLHLAPGTETDAVLQGLRTLLRERGLEPLVDIASAEVLRATSLRIFDRSFAVTYWLQAVAIAIGLFGVAASFSAQALARRREFGLLVHLGLTRVQVLKLAGAEGAVAATVGAAAGLGLGLAVSLVLVHVVNPQSFHWTMDLVLPWPRLLALCAAVVLAGTGTAWLASRAAAGRDAVLAVKDDW